jgi:prepilin peptidase CpaA
VAVELHRAALAGFALLILVAALEDFRRLAIPNWLVLALCLLWPLTLPDMPLFGSALSALGCALLVFVIGAVCFSRGWVGGGDVKLLSVAALWAGPNAVVPLLILTGVLGGLLAIVLLMPPAAHLASLARARLGENFEPFGNTTPVPYGIAIAGAAFLVTVLPQFKLS